MQDAAHVLSRIAENQHGVASRRQGAARGLTRGAMDHAVETGLVIAVAPGVYRMPGTPQSLAMATCAAALATGGRASHGTASRLLRLDAPQAVVPIAMTIDADAGHPRLTRVRVRDEFHAFFAVQIHRQRSFGEPLLTVDGIPCTDAARTLIDLAPALRPDQLADAFDRARDLGLVSPEVLARRFALVGGRGRAGTPKIRQVLEQAPPRPLQSQLERIASRLIQRSGLPEPVVQYALADNPGRYRLDFAWPDLLAAWETEGFEWHGTRARWKQDRLRVGRIEHAGWRHMIATWDDVVLRPTETLHRLGLMLAERRALVRAGALSNLVR